MAKKQPGVKFSADFYEFGRVKYAAGQTYQENEETLRAVALGNAEKVSVDADEVQPDLVEAGADGAQPDTAEKPAPQ